MIKILLYSKPLMLEHFITIIIIYFLRLLLLLINKNNCSDGIMHIQ